MSKVLRLTLKGSPFEVMKTGEKKLEFRKDSKWIRSRIMTKNGACREYDYAEFTNGYGKHRPSFKCEYVGFILAVKDDTYAYSNGLVVNVEKGDFVLILGDLIK